VTNPMSPPILGRNFDEEDRPLIGGLNRVSCYQCGWETVCDNPQFKVLAEHWKTCAPTQEQRGGWYDQPSTSTPKH
jgi:hypothetical protein